MKFRLWGYMWMAAGDGGGFFFISFQTCPVFYFIQHLLPPPPTSCRIFFFFFQRFGNVIAADSLFFFSSSGQSPPPPLQLLKSLLKTTFPFNLNSFVIFFLGREIPPLFGQKMSCRRRCFICRHITNLSIKSNNKKKNKCGYIYFFKIPAISFYFIFFLKRFPHIFLCVSCNKINSRAYHMRVGLVSRDDNYTPRL